MMVDLANLEWWQGALAIITVLGLSPAPWLTGLATNRIQFTRTARADHDVEVANVKAAHELEIANLKAYHESIIKGMQERYAELKESRDYYREARITEAQRANKVTDQLVEMADLARLATHALTSLDEAARDSTT